MSFVFRGTVHEGYLLLCRREAFEEMESSLQQKRPSITGAPSVDSITYAAE